MSHLYIKTTIFDSLDIKLSITSNNMYNKLQSV